MEQMPRRAAAPRDTTPAAPATRRPLVHAESARRIVRACHLVHQELGSGFLEAVYEAAVSQVLDEWGVPFQRQATVDVWFRGHTIGSYRADLIVDGRVLVELKAASRLVPEHAAQVLNYLKGTGLRVGLLANFGQRLEIRRLVR